jgi:hypothetical protein
MEKRRSQLREAESGDQGDPDLEDLPFDEEDENLTRQGEHLEDGDLEYINSIFNSFPSQTCYRQGSNQLKLKNFTTEDALTRARTSKMPPPNFNQNFNQNSTTLSSREDHLSYLSNTDYEGDSELGNYFSDDEEEDTEIGQKLKSEGNFWSSTTFLNSEKRLPLSQTAFSNWNPIISSLKTFEEEEEKTQIKHIAGFLEANQLGLSTWQPFIPLAPAFQNSAAHSQLSDFSSQASSSPEPTQLPISTISTSTKLTKSKTSLRRETSLSPPKGWLSSKPATMTFTTKLTKPWTESKQVCNGSQNWHTEFQDHPEQSNPFKHWTRPVLYSIDPNQNQNTSCQNTPPVADDAGRETQGPKETDLQEPVQLPRKKRPPNGSYETWPHPHFRSRQSPHLEQRCTSQQGSNAGSEPQVCTQWKSRNSSTTKSRTSTTKIKSWETKWRRCSNKIQTCRTKFRKPIGHRQKNSERTPLWPWYPRRWPPTCSSDTTTEIKDQPISPRGRNHFSKRRSESESYKNKSESTNSKSENKDKNASESESYKNKSEDKDKNAKTNKTFQDHPNNVTAKADKVETISEAKREVKITIGKQLKNGRKFLTLTKPDLPFLLHLYLATAFKNHILIFNGFLFFHFHHYFQPVSLRASGIAHFDIHCKNHNFTFKTPTANEATTPHSEVAICTQPLISITRLLLNTTNGNSLVPLLVENKLRKESTRNFWKPPFMESCYSHLRQLRHQFSLSFMFWIQLIGFQTSHLLV